MKLLRFKKACGSLPSNGQVKCFREDEVTILLSSEPSRSNSQHMIITFLTEHGISATTFYKDEAHNPDSGKLAEYVDEL